MEKGKAELYLMVRHYDNLRWKIDRNSFFAVCFSRMFFFPVFCSSSQLMIIVCVVSVES